MPEFVRCHTCKGLKKANGLGGITRDCWTCDGSGKIEKVSAVIAIPTPLKAETLCADTLKIETIPAAQAFESMGVPDSVVAQMAEMATDEIESVIKKKEVESVEDKVLHIQPIPASIFEGYSDELMQALLDEPKMPLVEWKKKYMYNKELFIVAKDGRGTDVIGQELLDLHMRNTIRLLYAQSKPIAPRSKNIMAAQEMVAKRDPDYVKYEREMKAKAELEAKKATA